MSKKKIRNVLISVFVVLWLIVFHYESTRHFFLSPLVGRQLPKLKFLFPPAGWIMFFNVDDQFGRVEVYGIKGESVVRIDPHYIIPTRFIGFDNIHRGIMGQITYQNLRGSFCQYMRRKIPYFDNFFVTYIYYPSLTQSPHKQQSKILYQCGKGP